MAQEKPIEVNASRDG